MKLSQAIEVVADQLIGKNNRTPGEDAAVVLYNELRNAETIFGVRIVSVDVMPDNALMLVSAQYTPERFASYERALKEINLGRHGKLDATQMALVAWVALRDGK